MGWIIGKGIGIPFRMGGSGLGSSYWANRSEFYLDGTIITVGADKYFEDLSSNARNFLITGYDFDSTWTKGFPYKSAATISAPVGDATLIAADINNFLYDAGGTPNAIPVVSLFQNIDYENKIFCKHEARIVVDDNEIYEPRVLEIYMAKIPESGTGLTKANTYFGVPEEIVDAIWVATDGNDTTGDGTKENPVATFQKALTLTGSSVYLKTGITDMDTTGATVRKNIYGIGYHRVTGLLTTGHNWTLDNTGTRIIKNLYFDTAYSLLFCSDITALNVENCFFKEYSYAAIYTVTIINAKNCIFTGSGYCLFSNANNSTLLAEDCLYKATGQARFSSVRKTGVNISLKYNKFVDVEYVMYGITNLLGNIISYGNKGSLAHYLNCGHMASFIGKHDQLTATNYYIQSPTDAPADVNLSDIIIESNSTSSILLLKGESLYAQRLMFTQNGTGAQFDISAPTTPAICQISDSVFISKNAGSGPLTVGDSSFASVNNITGYFKKNLILGNKLYVETPTSTHGFANWANDNFEIAYNFISGWYLAIVVKAPGTDLSNSTVHHNIIINGALTLKSQKLKIYNNTFYRDLAGYNHTNTKYDDTFYCIDNVFKNNIFITNGDYNFLLDDVNQTIISDYNLYYNPTGNMAPGQTFAQWQIAGQDANSRFLTVGELAALLTNIANDIYTLPVGSLAIGYGVDLGEDFKDGLDASTDWGSETELPTVATKQQGDSWDCGAFIH